jgi:transcriptional regulator with XRE-family HTH domain
MVHHPSTRPEQPDLHRIYVEVQNRRQFFHRKTFYFLQKQKLAILFGQFLQDLFEEVSRLDSLTGRLRRPVVRNDAVEPGNLLFREIGLVKERPHFLFPQIIPAFVHRNLVEPRGKRGALVESLERDVRLHENLLRDVLYVFSPAEDAAYEGENAMLVAADEFLESRVVPILGLSDEAAVFFRTGAPREWNGDRCCLRCHGFWDVTHAILVTLRFSRRVASLVLQDSVVFATIPAMIIGDRIRLLRETKKLSQGDIEKRTGLLRCYISRVENGHTVPAIETLEKLARAMEVPLYQLFYDGEEPPELPNLPKRKSADDIAWGNSGKDARMLGRFRRLLSRIDDGDRRLLMYMAQKMAHRP